MNDAVLVRREGRVLVLVNNNPAARNAITPGFYEGLAAGLAQAQATPGSARWCSPARVGTSAPAVT